MIEEGRDLDEALRLIEGIERWNATHRLETRYAAPYPHAGGPYPWQVAFHEAGAKYIERASICANQVGKSFAASAEVAIHATGLYPSWWKGRRIAEPNDWWVCEPTNLFCRDIAQTLLLGSVGGGEGEDRAPDGTGWVPLDRIGEFGFRQCGIPNVIDRVKIRHQSGGWSTIQFKSYEQSPTMFEGATLNGGVWLDEEPEGETAMTIFSSCRTRVVVKGGMVLFTRTPLFGHSGIVRHFMGGKEGIWYQNVTWDDAPHMTAEMKRAAEMSYPEHERDARTKGVPMLGSGAVYAVAQSLYTCEAFPIPPHWRRICGIDFGIDHPAAGAWIAHDPDTDTIYVYDAYRMSGKVAAYHAQAIRSRGDWIPVAWPHDGAIRDKGGGVALAEQYRECGANMMPFSARLDDEKGGGQPREPTTQAILQRMHTGQLKVFSHLSELLEEMRMLHRKDGVIVPVNDDTEAAVRYATMMLRHACTKSEAVSPRPAFSEDYDPLESFR